MARAKRLARPCGFPITDETHGLRVQRIGAAIQAGMGRRDDKDIAPHLKLQAFEMADDEATKEMMDDIHAMLRMLLERTPA